MRLKIKFITMIFLVALAWLGSASAGLQALNKADLNAGLAPRQLPQIFPAGFEAADQAAWQAWIERPPTPPVPVDALLDGLMAPRQFEAPTFPELTATTELEDLPPTINSTLQDLDHYIHDGISPQLQQDARQQLSTVVQATDDRSRQMYRDIEQMFTDIDQMDQQLEANYAALNQVDFVDADMAKQFNAASDKMADRVALMMQAIDGMLAQNQADIDFLKAFKKDLTKLIKTMKGQAKDRQQMQKHISGFKDDLQAYLAELYQRDDEFLPNFKSVIDYLDGVVDYIDEAKATDAEQNAAWQALLDYLDQVQSTLARKVRPDLEATRQKLEEYRDYFRSAKIEPDQDPINDICEDAEPEGMQSLKECSRSCRSVCRWKKKVQDVDCYECPSGSPDSCYDVGAWPSNHPWCQPGGICYSDPMLYCTPFGTTGPQGEPLNCTNCKQRPDMCWQHFPNTTTFTNCKLGCTDGTCEYVGRYDEIEWDGRAEWIHCFECKTPPPPPSCEDLQWGYDFEEDCLDDCPDPGQCVEVTHNNKGAKDKKPDADPGQPGAGANDGSAEGGTPPPEAGQGGQPGGGEGTGEDGNRPSGGTPNQPNPPGGTPAQPGGGGGFAPGQGTPPATPTNGATTGSGNRQPPTKPQGGAPQLPTTPNTPPPGGGSAPQPPTNPTIQWYSKWLSDVNEQIRERQEILANPDEGPYTKAEAGRQLKYYTREQTRLRQRIQDEINKEKARRAEATRRREQAEAYRRQRAEELASRPRQKSFRELEQEYRLNQLKESTERLQTRSQEMQATLQNRQSRIDWYDREIRQAQREIEHYETGKTNGTFTSEFADKQISIRRRRIQDYTANRNQLSQQTQTLQSEFQREMDQLLTDYRRKLWSVDSRAREKAEMERIDEYFEEWANIKRAEQQREVSRQVFESKIKELEDRIKNPQPGDDVGNLEDQLANLKRGQQEWDATYQRRIDNATQYLENLRLRNMYEGVGPGTDAELGTLLESYANKTKTEISNYELMRNDFLQKIETAERSGQDMTQARQQLAVIDARIAQMKEGVTVLEGYGSSVRDGYPLSEEDRAITAQTAARIAEGSKGQAADKSFARLFAESLGEEVARTALDPRVRFKKSVAFAWGMTKGVVKGVGGLIQLGVGAADALAEATAINMGFEDGGIFGTDATETLYSVLSTVYDNANFDGITKAAIAAGGAIDKKLTALERSGDIDWATAEFGGEIAGEFVVADAVIAGAFSKGASLLRGVDEAADAGRALNTTTDLTAGANQATDAATGVRNLDNLDIPAGTTPDVPAGGARPTGAGDGVPTGTTPDTRPPTRGPPDAATTPRQPKPARTYDNTQPLPDSGRAATALDETTLSRLETENGFRQDHAQRMNEFAQEKDVFLIVRDGNPDSVRYFSDPDLMPKPMSSKAKTAKVGPNRGLVVDPTHATQAQYWDDAIAEAAATAARTGDSTHLNWLKKNRRKAIDSWNDYGQGMLDNGYRVNPETGVIEFVEKLPDGTEKVWKGIHGDYDLHGVYRRTQDGAEHVSYGSGRNFDGNGVDVEGTSLRSQLNDKLTGGDKDFIQHGGQDDWVPDASKIPNKPPDPPATVFFPDGRPPKRLNTAEEMRRFYEDEMGVQFPYQLDAAADASKAVGQAASAVDNLAPPMAPAMSLVTRIDDVGFNLGVSVWVSESVEFV